MSKPMIRIFDVATGETIDREMTDAEFQAYNNANVIETQKKTQEQAAKAAAEAKLAALGLTADDLKALGL